MVELGRARRQPGARSDWLTSSSQRASIDWLKIQKGKIVHKKGLSREHNQAESECHHLERTCRSTSHRNYIVMFQILELAHHIFPELLELLQRDGRSICLGLSVLVPISVVSLLLYDHLVHFLHRIAGLEAETARRLLFSLFDLCLQMCLFSCHDC